jgi:hypothetical protein
MYNMGKLKSLGIIMQAKKEISNSPILRETLNTESSYADSLILLQKQFEQWGSIWWSVSAPKELVTLSKLLPSLIDISTRIKSNLLLSMRFDVDAVAPTDQAERAKRAIERIQLIKLFAHVINDYAPALNAYNLSMCNQTPHKMDSGALIMNTLIAPIQRGPRYDLLISTILKLHGDSLSQTNKDSCTEIQACIRKALASDSPAASSSSSSSAPTDTSYHFGDYTKTALSYFFSTPTLKPTVPVETKESISSPSAKK